MVGNVNQLVESMNAANNARSQQSSAHTNSENFKNYLDTALLNSRSSLLTNGLYSNGLGSGSSYLNSMSGSLWQTVVLEALKDELKKERDSEDKESTDTKEGSSSSKSEKTKKEDWATIRVIRRYQSPKLEENIKSKGIAI